MSTKRKTNRELEIEYLAERDQRELSRIIDQAAANLAAYRPNQDSKEDKLDLYSARMRKQKR